MSVNNVAPTLALDGDHELLLSAVGYVVQNAVKFTHADTKVTLKGTALGDRIEIEISDRCGGLSPEIEALMFLPFMRPGVDRGCRLGLGLTIAKQSITSNGGTIHVRNVPQVGCVFTISLPRATMPC